MRLVSFAGGFGRVEGDSVVPMGSDILEFLQSGARADRSPVEPGALTLLAPVPHPPKIIGIGLNYRDHAAEVDKPLPEEPILFAKFGNSVIGPGAPIRIPEVVTEPDFEAELGVVIGRMTSRVSPENALDVVAGYTCLNDVSSRDLQFSNGGQWLRGKAIDTFLPMGPHLVTADEVPDPTDLRIRCLVNGRVFQDSTTAQMVFNVARLISFISQTITLGPGDVIATGTPAGVGFVHQPQVFLKPGDEVSVEIDRIGALSNTVERVP